MRLYYFIEVIRLKNVALFAEEKVYKEIKQAILTRQYYPKSQLIENEIAQKLGISRTPVRAALKKLAYEGLVDIVPNKGAFIVEPTFEEFKQIASSRIILEKEAARLAALQIKAAEIHQLNKLLDEEMNYSQKRDLENYINTNMKIHMSIAKASKNKYFIKYIEELITKTTIYLIFFDRFYSTSLEELNSIKEHKNLITAITGKDPQLSMELMEMHIGRFMENIGN